MGRLTELDRRLADAPESVRAQVEVLADQLARLLDQAEDDQAWAEQVGPAYTAKQVAALLGVTRQAVRQRRGLLRLEQRNGKTVYPVWQFDGATVLPGIQKVVLVLTPAVASPWTIASWLTSPNAELDGLRPYEELRHGNLTPVVEAAQRWATALNR
jgi:hypothetical protein